MPSLSESIIHPRLSLDWLRGSSTGKGVQVAVLDSGVDASHPDLAGRIVRSVDVRKAESGAIVCSELPPGASSDLFGHGTSVAGIIADIAPGAEIISVRMLNEQNACTGDVLIEGLRWALQQRIKLINMSLATIREQYLPALFRLCEQAYEQEAILVVSRRNHGAAGWPALFSSVIAVERGEFDDRLKLRYRPADLIECDAHGTRVRTATPGGGYSEQTGTSYAAPHVTGIVALLLEHRPNLIAAEAKTVLRAFSET